VGIEVGRYEPQGTRLLTDVSGADWIVQRLWPWGLDLGTRVGALVPEGFEAYVRLFHPNRRGSGNLGTLSRNETIALAGLLRDFTSSEKALFCLWDGFGFLSDRGSAWLTKRRGTFAEFIKRWRARRGATRALSWVQAIPLVRTQARAYLMYEGPFDAVANFTHMGGQYQSPNIWWPEDRAWCVATEIDLRSSLVGCSAACAEALFRSDVVSQIVPVRLEDRLDIHGDAGSTL
jgi:hypothetical protein